LTSPAHENGADIFLHHDLKYFQNGLIRFGGDHFTALALQDVSGDFHDETPFRLALTFFPPQVSWQPYFTKRKLRWGISKWNRWGKLPPPETRRPQVDRV
jgi:hypothetical protein